MGTYVTNVMVNGSDWSLCDITDCVIRVGQSDGSLTTSPQPADLRLGIICRLPGQWESVRIGDPISITAWGTPRFFGRITDIGGQARRLPTPLQITATSPLAWLPEQPAQAWRAGDILMRTADIAKATGQGTDLIAGSENSWVQAITSATPRDALARLITSYGANVSDVGSGRLSIVADRARNRASGQVMLSLSCDQVQSDLGWTADIGQVQNVIRWTWGDPPQTGGDLTTSWSPTQYGSRLRTIDTMMYERHHGEARAARLLDAGEHPYPRLSAVTLIWDRLTTEQQDIITTARPGRVRVTIDGPRDTPLDQWSGYLEGWVETHTPRGVDYRLGLSDYRLTSTGGRWQDLDPAETWEAVTNKSYDWTQDTD